MNREERIREVIEDVVEQEGFSIKKVSFEKMDDKDSLVVTIYSDRGVTTDDCARVSRKIDSLLDEAGLINDNSFLIVSSPGTDSLNK